MVGELDRRISIYELVETANSYGERTTTNNLVKTVWAKIEPEGGNEKITGDKPTASRSVRFTIRYRTGLIEKMKISYDGNWYNILSIEEPDRKRYLSIIGEKQF